MSVYFVYRSHYDNPGAFYVKVFPQDTVLEWFQSIWIGISDAGHVPFPSELHTQELFGHRVYVFGDLFTQIHQQGWPPPASMTSAARHLAHAMSAIQMTFGQHHVQLLDDLDDLERAIYIFDDRYAAKNPHRAAFLMREEWRLPDGAADQEFGPKQVPKVVKLVRGEGTTYFAHFAAHDGEALSEMSSWLSGKVAGVRLQDFPRYLFALRTRVAKNEDDEALNGTLRELLSGLDAVIGGATGDEVAFLAALSENPNDYAGWCAYSDWRMDRARPPLLADILRRYGADAGAVTQDTRDPSKDEAFVQTHVAQASKHVARWGERDLYHHFILFDDEWANAHRDLAASILRTASRWDPL